jgi:membrane protein DedA with SNARE-associated domain
MIVGFIASYGYLDVFSAPCWKANDTDRCRLRCSSSVASLQSVVLVASLGAWLGDTLAFLGVRWKGVALLDRFPMPTQRKARMHALFHRHDAIFILAFRFLHGFRVASPVMLGSSRLPLVRFMAFILLGAVIWAALISCAGYLPGATASLLIVVVKRVVKTFSVVIISVGLVIWLWRRLHS